MRPTFHLPVFLVLVLLAVLPSRSMAQEAECSGVDAQYDMKGSTEPLQIKLGVSAACKGDLTFRIVGSVVPTTNTRGGKTILIKGTPQIQTEELGPTGVYRVSVPELENPTLGAKEAMVKDVYPEAGDADGKAFLLVQSGAKNWVEYTVPEFYKLSQINVYETLNPGGVTKVELLTATEAFVVYDFGKGTSGPGFSTTVTEVMATEGDKQTGARKLIMRFNVPKFKPTLLRVWIDATKEWRGIDFIGLQGETETFPPLPGNLNDDKLVVTPMRNYGCDRFSYQVKMNEWSSQRYVTVCYGAPFGANGKICSGNGEPRNSECVCGTSPAWKGDDCSIPKCPGEQGRLTVCNGRGKCGGPADPFNKCACDPAFIGPGCVYQKVASHCHFVGDPHWATFDHRFTGDRTYYNMYEEGEYLEYFMNDPDLNPDYEAIGHQQAKPWSNHYVTANQWIVFRKGKDFVKITNSGDIRVGRDGESCYESNIASTVIQNQRDGKPYETPDGLRITQEGGNGWRVASNVPGKNPSNTILIAYNGWLYLDGYIFIDTARVGKAVGLCGNFDGQGNDLGSYWRYGEPTQAVSNNLRIPAERSLGTCKGAMTRPVAATQNLIQEQISLQPKLSALEQRAQLRYITKGGSNGAEHGAPAGAPTLSMEQVDALIRSVPTSRKGGKASTLANASVATSLIGTSAEAELDLAATEGGKVESLESALTECGNKPVSQDDFPKLSSPLSRTHAALDDCFTRTLGKTAAADQPADVVTAAKATTTGAKAILAILANFPQSSQARDDYLNCIADLCASGKTEDWQGVQAVDAHLDVKEERTDQDNVEQTQRIEGKELVTK